jgi:hypothetical protein
MFGRPVALIPINAAVVTPRYGDSLLEKGCGFRGFA